MRSHIKSRLKRSKARRLIIKGMRIALKTTAIIPLLLASGSQVRAQEGDTGMSEVVLDTEINGILHQEFDPVFTAAGLDPRNVTIVIQTHVFNAAAASNQLLFIGTDLIEKTQNPNELIGVIAHETGHAAGYHAARRGEEERAGLALQLRKRLTSESMGHHDSEDHGWAAQRSRPRWSYGLPRFGR